MLYRCVCTWLFICVNTHLHIYIYIYRYLLIFLCILSLEPALGHKPNEPCQTDPNGMPCGSQKADSHAALHEAMAILLPSFAMIKDDRSWMLGRDIHVGKTHPHTMTLLEKVENPEPVSLKSETAWHSFVCSILSSQIWALLASFNHLNASTDMGWCCIFISRRLGLLSNCRLPCRPSDRWEMELMQTSWPERARWGQAWSVHLLQSLFRCALRNLV